MPSVGVSRRDYKPYNGSAFPKILKVPVNNIIGLDKYYRSATLLLRQADEYRRAGDDYQLYTMLMRFASLVLETIPQHAKFSQGGQSEHTRFKTLLVERYMPELEQIKVAIALREKEGQFRARHAHASDTVQLVTSNLPELHNWSMNGSVTPSPAQQPQQALDLDRLALSGADIFGPVADSPASTSGKITEELPSWAVPSSTLRLPPASQAARNRHALLPVQAQPARRTSGPAALPLPLYPEFDATPAQPIDWGSLDRTSSGSLASTSLPSPSAPPMPGGPHPGYQAAVSGELLPRNRHHQQQQAPSLLDAEQPLRPGEAVSQEALLAQLQQPSPHLELQLGPQEVQVQSLPAPDSMPAPGETCSHAAPDVEVVPPLGSDPPGPVVAAEKVGIREVQVSMALMDEFLKYAASNTRRGVESCGILAGLLDEKAGCFQISTLIIPKQEGTSDTALNEEEIFEVQDRRSLYPLGWIHTHPTQTCFLSSVDVHTQCGYQTMLEEAVAIVMAPRDSSKRCGLFRLSTPGGLQLVQKCPQRGFHTHAPTATGQAIYELCGHVYLNPRVRHDVVDLR